MEALFQEPERLATALLVSLPRLFGAFLLLPFFRSEIVPGPVRNAEFIMISIVVIPLNLFDPRLLEIGSIDLTFLLFKEFAIGALIGFLAGLTFLLPQIAGDFIDNQRGASIAQVFNPAQGDQSSNLGLFLSQAWVAWWILVHGLTAIYAVFISSYILYPVLDSVPSFDRAGLSSLLSLFSEILVFGFLLAAPIVFGVLLVELALGLVNRFAPQLNVFFLSMSFKSVTAMLILVFYFGVLLAEMDNQDYLDYVLRVVPQILFPSTEQSEISF